MMDLVRSIQSFFGKLPEAPRGRKMPEFTLLRYQKK